MLEASDIRKRFESYLQGLDYSHDPRTLYAPVRYVLSLGGKRIRPTLLAMAYNMYADTVENVFPTAAGMEIFHNFTLLHDDLMDRADVRRGQPTVHVKWNENTAVLSGDVMLVMAYQFISRSDPSKLSRILDIANRTYMEIMDGQQYDMDFENRNDVSEREYLEMIRLKTSVLLAACVEMGAVLGGASEQDAQLLYRFGEKLGLAFQLQDDLLDVYGDPKVFGKKIGGDILCNKKTYLYINARLLSDPGQLAQLDRWAAYDGDDAQSKISAVRAVYDAVGVRALSEKLIGSLLGESLECLDRVSVDESRKRIIRQYAESLMGRVL
ncbi:MAG: polyprenyl synthetase family protein [Bacteroidaceae bacterium]|nr:polyprenyl synthetase family protein [Bacteroidaceae bacterium]